MPKLVKNGALTEDKWSLVEESFDLAQLASGLWILPLPIFISAHEQGLVDFDRCGVQLNGSDDVNELSEHLNKLKIIAIHFDAFADGRSFSQARILSDQQDFEGEIRAVGKFMQDQLFYLKRCGVNSFLLPDETDLASALTSLEDFSDSYQAASDEPQPLFRRRV